MSETATQSPKTADAAGYKQVISQMLAGVGASGVAKVIERGPRTFDGRQTEVLRLESMGFAQVFYSEDPSEHREWPHTGDLVSFFAPIAKGKDGYRLSNPTKFTILVSES